MFLKQKQKIKAAVVSLFVGLLLLPSAARAQMATVDPWEIAKEVLRTAASQALSTGLDYFIRKTAYDMAIFVSSGGKGQSPMAFEQQFGNYLQDVGQAAAGAALDKFSTSVVSQTLGEGAANGLNICNMPDFKVDLALKIGFNFKYGSEPLPPRCTLKQLKDNWAPDKFKSKYLEPGASQKFFNASLEADDSSDFDIALRGMEEVESTIRESKLGAQLDRQEGEGFKAGVDKISGYIRTPVQSIKKDATESASVEEAQKKVEARVNAAIGSGEPVQMIGTFASVFLNTLAGQMYKNFKECGTLIGSSCNKGNFVDITGTHDYGALGGRGGASAAAGAFGGLLVSPLRQLDQYDILTKYSSCGNASDPGPEECIIDQQMVTALQQSAQGNLITLGEAIEKGIIDGNKKLIPPSNSLSNDSNYCWTQGFCLSNVKKMRKARILSLGFEIAVMNSDPDNPWLLKDVVKGYSDPSRPYYHFIDPNWVLKVPLSRCNAMGYGTHLSSVVENRDEECVDLASCVSGDEMNGSCRDYAYCAREKNVWRFSADSCEAQYRTCRAFTSSDGQKAAYLYRTLDTKNCGESNAGCNAYSLTKGGPAGNWLAPAFDNTASDNTLWKNTGAFFNGKLLTSCSSGSAGCSAFKLAGTENNPEILYLRKAPDYLGCYDTNAATAGIQWPVTRADLLRVKDTAECHSYASACLPDEERCNWYEPVSYFGDSVPGKFKPAEVVNNRIVNWNDQCDAKCEGYAAYREMPSNYAVGADRAYIVPSSGSACTAAEEGCEGFTNMGTTVGGMEKVEYFAYLRPCIQPDTAKQKNFYTYEGSLVGGFQLRPYILEKDADGGPKYWFRLGDDIDAYNNVCAETLYKAGTADPDCREFNDDQGNIFYRLLSKTIAVSDKCTPYRLNHTELADVANNVCFQDGEFKDGYCYYNGLPSEVENTAGVSRGCSAAVETCRAYKGNAGNNVKQIFYDDFENPVAADALTGWSSVSGAPSVTTESTRAGGHSVSSVGGLKKSGSFVPGKSYDLTFWAKGEAGNNVEIRFDDGSSRGTFGEVTVGESWRSYHLGPVELQSAAMAQLLFAGEAGKRLFLDNVRLVEISDYLYLVKNSLKVDPICDSNPDDNLPGEALGCSAYKDPGNTTFYLTNFSYLCREEAIGCAAVLDTQNTLDTDKPKAYNVRLSGVPGTTAEITFPNGDKVSCAVPVGDSGCYANVYGHTAGEINTATGGLGLVESTVYIPADTPDSAPIYLVANREATCNKADLGCTYAGVEVSGPLGVTFVTTTIKNDPVLYEGENSALCTGEALGCKAYNSDKGISFFKDPFLTGGKICEFKTDMMIGSRKTSGWFWKGVGACSAGGGRCVSDTDCGGATGSCAGIGKQPCYPNYLVNGNFYELWSYGDTGRYDNFVGECPAAQNNCAELVDHSANDAKYYYIADGKLNPGDCAGQVSQKSGCILLDRTDNPNKYYQTVSSYLASEAQDSAKVDTVKASDPAQNDANLIVKVQRDRECGEWLKCQDSHPVYNEKTGKWNNICYTIGRCNKLSVVGESTGSSECESWVDSEFKDEILTAELYKNRRDTSWKGMDFSGYSIFGAYPPEELEQVNVSSTGKDWRLAKRVPCGGAKYTVNNDSYDICDKPASPTSVICKMEITVGTGVNAHKISTDGLSCGFRGNRGVCFNGLCLQGPRGEGNDVNASEDAFKETTPEHSCRAYPEKDAPFPNTTGIRNALDVRNIQQFATVPICSGQKSITVPSANPNDLDATACECDYSKVNYGTSLSKYFGPSSIGVTPFGVCQGGATTSASGDLVSLDGQACEKNVDCGNSQNPGTCQIRSKTASFVGWRGFCIEDDTTKLLNANEKKHPCLTWLPIDYLIGAPDINGQHPEAGFMPPTDDFQPYYCLKANLFKKAVFPETPTIYDCVYRNPLTTVCDSCIAHAGYTVTEVRFVGDDDYPNDAQDYPVCMNQRSQVGPLTIGDVCVCVQQLVDASARETPAWQLNDNSNDFFRKDLSLAEFSMGCETVAKVSNGLLEYTAWTNRTWKDGEHTIQSVVTDPTPRLPDQNPSVNYTYTIPEPGQLRKPFGFANEPRGGSDLDKLLIMPWCIVKDGSYTLAYTMPRANLGKAPAGDVSGCVRDNSDTIPGSDWGINQARSYNRWSIGTYAAQLRSIWPTEIESAQIGADRLSQIFAKFYDISQYESRAGYASQNISNIKLDYTFKDAAGNFMNSNSTPPPKVVPLDETDCVGSDKCAEKDGSGISIVADGSMRSSGDVKIASYPAKAIMKFYVYADKDKMPIRNVKVDWGDGNQPISLDGSYRNARGLAGVLARPFCNDSKKCMVNGVERPEANCNIDKDCQHLDKCAPEASAPDFGLIAGRTCDSVYWRFDHPYNCEVGNANWKNGLKCPDTNMANNFGGCCVYVPAVQVTDNWGWCNGRCAKAYGSNDNPTDDYSPGCYYNVPPNDLNQCDTGSDAGKKIDAWTYFGGQILVAPKR